MLLPTFAISSALLFYATLVLLFVPVIRRHLSDALIMPTPSTGMHVSSLDAIRGLAALWVAAYHLCTWVSPALNDTLSLLPLINHGLKAVPIFAILSGFLIYRSARKIASIEQLRNYAKRRALRIFPLYAITVIIGFAFFTNERELLPINRFFSELLMLRAIGHPVFLNPASWSLYVEILFYIVLPIAIITVRPWHVRAVVVALVCLILGDVPSTWEVQLWKYFCMGILASEAFDYLRNRAPEPLAIVIFAVGAVLLLIDLHYDWYSNAMGQISIALGFPIGSPADGTNHNYTIGLGLAGVCLVLGASLSRIMNRIFSFAPLHVLGVISYSVFLWHGLLLAAFFPLGFTWGGRTFLDMHIPALPAWYPFIVVLPGILFWSAVSFVFIEKPFLSLSKTTRQNTKPISV